MLFFKSKIFPKTCDRTYKATLEKKFFSVPFEICFKIYKMLSILTRCAVARGVRTLCPLPIRALSSITPKFHGNQQKSVSNVTSKLPMVRPEK